MSQIQMPTKPPFKQFFWPDVDNLESAHAAGMSGFAIAAINAVITGIFVAFKLHGFNYLNIADCFLFALIAWGIKSRMSRIAAICGLTFYLVERIFSPSSASWPDRIAPIAIFTLFFVNGIRGTFAYQRLLHEKPDDLTRTE